MPPHACDVRAASGRCCAGERPAEDGVNSRPSAEGRERLPLIGTTSATTMNRRVAGFNPAFIVCALVIPVAAVFALIVPVAALAQARTFAEDGIEFTLELPSPTWRWVVEPIGLRKRVEFINGDDCLSGCLSVRKILLDADLTPEDLFKRKQSEKLQFLPGFVACDDGGGREFKGHLSGAVFCYEYTDGGRLMTGRIYYLYEDKRTVYALHFKAALEKLPALREQMDRIARSFRVR